MADRPTSRWLVWVAATLPVLLVGAVVGGYFYLQPVNVLHPGLGQDDSSATPTAAPATLQLDRDYYLFAKTIELYPRQPGDETWDRFDGSAPDIQYSITWQGHTVFTSSVRDNTLLATWDGITLDLRKALFEGTIEPGRMLNQAAPVNVTADGKITINVWDEDPFGLGRDAAGAVTLRLADLHPGDNTLHLDASPTNGIKRIVLRATATDQPVDNLLEAIAAP